VTEEEEAFDPFGFPSSITAATTTAKQQPQQQQQRGEERENQRSWFGDFQQPSPPTSLQNRATDNFDPFGFQEATTPTTELTPFGFPTQQQDHHSSTTTTSPFVILQPQTTNSFQFSETKTNNNNNIWFGEQQQPMSNGNGNGNGTFATFSTTPHTPQQGKTEEEDTFDPFGF